MNAAILGVVVVILLLQWRITYRLGEIYNLTSSRSDFLGDVGRARNERTMDCLRSFGHLLHEIHAHLMPPRRRKDDAKGVSDEPQR